MTGFAIPFGAAVEATLGGIRLVPGPEFSTLRLLLHHAFDVRPHRHAHTPATQLHPVHRPCSSIFLPTGTTQLLALLLPSFPSPTTVDIDERAHYYSASCHKFDLNGGLPLRLVPCGVSQKESFSGSGKEVELTHCGELGKLLQVGLIKLN